MKMETLSRVASAAAAWGGSCLRANEASLPVGVGDGRAEATATKLAPSGPRLELRRIE